MMPLIFAVNAVSGGGKTVVTTELQKRLPNAKALYFDDNDYDVKSGINDICAWIEDGSDVNLFNLEPLVNDINKLINEGVDYIILDYPFGYRQTQIAGFINYSIFIDTPLDVALARRILRDYNKETVSTIFCDMVQYLERGRNAYLQGLESTKEMADFVVDGCLPIDNIVDIICVMINKQITLYNH